MKVHHNQAREAALSLRAMYREGVDYQRWEFAGSLRRQRPACSDVDHVIVPVVTREPAPPDPEKLFDDPCRPEVERNRLWDRTAELIGDGRLLKGHQTLRDGSTRACWGERSKIVLHHGLNHGLYTAHAATFGYILAIRTGPAGFSKDLVTQLKREGFTPDGGFICDRQGRRVDVPTEEALFKLLGRAVPDPRYRA